MGSAQIKRNLSCGVLITDGASLLLGHATRSRYWDIPKGLAMPGESPAAAAVRELNEETGLVVNVNCLVDLGQHPYRPRKDLALFAWYPTQLPDPAQLVCRTTFSIGKTSLPELDRFGLFSWDEALARVGRNLARILGAVRPVAAKSSRSKVAVVGTRVGSADAPLQRNRCRK